MQYMPVVYAVHAVYAVHPRHTLHNLFQIVERLGFGAPKLQIFTHGLTISCKL